MRAFQEVKQCSGIDVAGTRGHDHSAHGTERHRRCNGTAVLQCSGARAVSEMRNDGSRVQLRPEYAADVLVRKSVKTVAPQKRIACGKRQRARKRGQITKKRGVETRDLDDARQ